MLYSCDTCRRPVALDEGFFRSVNLRPVAWCRPCWFAKKGLPLPAQRRAPDEENAPRTERRRRRLIRR